MRAVLHGVVEAIKNTKPMELSLVVMNLLLVYIMWDQFAVTGELRSVKLLKFVQADYELNVLLATCILHPHY